MKSRILFVTAAFTLAVILFAFTRHNGNDSQNYTNNFLMRWNARGCAPDWEFLEKYMEENEIPPFPGAGSYKWKINTKSDSAQFYFNQGINMYYSFHIIEAMASFKKAEKFDPGCAMLHWAQALTYGPNINDIGYAASPEALATSRKAMANASVDRLKEYLLISAQYVRYSEDSTQKRENLNQQYVDKMKAAYEKFPDDPDVAALYADALMLQHPWDLWKIDGTPRPWTPLIRSILEKLLAKTPNHPGANHYYIHVMEPSPYFAKAIPSADRLGKLTPGLSHTVHMPSHIYLRAGQYDKGVAVNVSAVSSYNKAVPLYAPVTGNDFLYVIHNLHMQTNNAMLAANWEVSRKSAEETVKSIKSDYLDIPGAMGNYVQYIYMTPTLVNVRFGKWTEILREAAPESKRVYENLIYRFGLGMALVNKGYLERAKTELATLRQLMKDSILKLPFAPFSSSIEGAKVAESLLAGTIALKEKKFEEAISHFKHGVTTEENMVYNEPRDWLLSPKHYLADAYIKTGRCYDASEILQKDLLNNNDNAWALYGLLQSLSCEKKLRSAELEKVRVKIKKLYPSEKLGVKLNGPVL